MISLKDLLLFLLLTPEFLSIPLKLTILSFLSRNSPFVETNCDNENEKRETTCPEGSNHFYYFPTYGL